MFQILHIIFNVIINVDTMAIYFYNTVNLIMRGLAGLQNFLCALTELYGRPRLCGTYATTDICCHLGIDSVTGRVLGTLKSQRTYFFSLF